MPEKKPAVVYRGKFLRVKKVGHWEYVERTHTSGVVVILPLTRDRKIILVEQFRVAVRRNVIGLPAGLAGDAKKKKESLLAAAKRELLEETGRSSRRWKFLAQGPSSPGLTNELITFFLAARVTRRPPLHPDLGEKITVHAVALRDLSAWLRRRRAAGSLIDYKIFAALHLAPAT